MNFLEAMALLNAKKSVTRKAWEGQGIVLSSLEDMSFKFHLPESQSELMTLTDWIECEPIEYCCFEDAIKVLLKGGAIKRPRWSRWIFLNDRQFLGKKRTVFLVISDLKNIENAVSEVSYEFMSKDFVANDWIIKWRIK